jgi:hypothetical protein
MTDEETARRSSSIRPLTRGLGEFGSGAHVDFNHFFRILIPIMYATATAAAR